MSNSKERKDERSFLNKGNQLGTLDRKHDKLMGYQNSTFPIAIYGSIDTASRKILCLKIWTLEHLYEKRTVVSQIGISRGSETGIMATMHSYLRQSNGDMNPFDTVIYGPSTSNQVCHYFMIRKMKFYKKYEISFTKC